MKIPLLPVCVQMMPGRVFGVLSCVEVVRVRQMRVMRSLLVIARFVVLRCLRMMMRGQTVMMRCLAMLVNCMLCHRFPPVRRFERLCCDSLRIIVVPVLFVGYGAFN